MMVASLLFYDASRWCMEYQYGYTRLLYIITSNSRATFQFSIFLSQLLPPQSISVEYKELTIP